MTTMKLKVKRLWHGEISLRDYQVREAIKNGQDIRVAVGDQFALIPHNCLHTGHVNKELFSSKHGTPSYRLVDYNFNLYKMPEEIPLSLFESHDYNRQPQRAKN